MSLPHFSSALRSSRGIPLTRVRDDISLGDLPTLWAGKYLREMIFAVLVKLVPGLYSAVLRWR